MLQIRRQPVGRLISTAAAAVGGDQDGGERLLRRGGGRGGGGCAGGGKDNGGCDKELRTDGETACKALHQAWPPNIMSSEHLYSTLAVIGLGEVSPTIWVLGQTI